LMTFRWWSEPCDKRLIKFINWSKRLGICKSGTRKWWKGSLRDSDKADRKKKWSSTQSTGSCNSHKGTSIHAKNAPNRDAHQAEMCLNDCTGKDKHSRGRIPRDVRICSETHKKTPNRWERPTQRSHLTYCAERSRCEKPLRTEYPMGIPNRDHMSHLIAVFQIFYHIDEYRIRLLPMVNRSDRAFLIAEGLRWMSQGGPDVFIASTYGTASNVSSKWEKKEPLGSASDRWCGYGLYRGHRKSGRWGSNLSCSRSSQSIKN
jgi:hypothetical protein